MKSEWVSLCLKSHLTHYRSFWRRFLQNRWPNQQFQGTEGSQLDVKIRLQFHRESVTTAHNVTTNKRKATASKHRIRVPVWQKTIRPNIRFNPRPTLQIRCVHKGRRGMNEEQPADVGLCIMSGRCCHQLTVDLTLHCMVVDCCRRHFVSECTLHKGIHYRDRKLDFYTTLWNR